MPAAATSYDEGVVGRAVGGPVEIISVDRSGRISIGDLALLPDGVHVVLDHSGVSVRRERAA
jgi:hypothetical protein